MTRILYLNHVSVVSGAELSLLQLMRGLDPQRYQPLVVLPSEGRYSEMLRQHQIPYQILPLDTVRKSAPLKQLKNAIKLRRLLKTEHIGLIHANSFHAIKLVWPLCRLTRTPLVGSIRDIIPFPRAPGQCEF